MKYAGLALAGIVFLFALSFVITGGDFAMFKFWAPKYANAQRQVFENTQGYVQGKMEYLSRLRLQYETADDGSTEKAALRTLILSEAVTVDRDKLPPDLQGFLNRLAAGVGPL